MGALHVLYPEIYFCRLMFDVDGSYTVVCTLILLQERPDAFSSQFLS